MGMVLKSAADRKLGGEMTARRGPVSPAQLGMVKVRDVMNARPRKVNPETTIDELIERLLSQIEGCFPVVVKNDKIVGIVTESDVLQILHVPTGRAIVGPDAIKEVRKRMATTVGDIMTKDPVTVSPNASIQEVLNIMSTHKLRHIPVVEGGKLVGMVCLRNIVEFYRLIR